MKNLTGYSRLLPWLFALFISLLLSACGGGGGDAGRATILGTGTLAPLVPPKVTLVTPFAKSTGVARNLKIITAAFSKPMAPASLTAASLTLACPAATPITGGTVTYLSASKIAVLTLPTGTVLPASTLCTATVTTAATDTTGIALAANHVWQFTTGATSDTTAPQVVATINANGATNVATNTRVGATFSEAMNPLTLTTTSFTLKQGVTPVAGSLTYSGLNAVFVPTALLASGTLYTATVTTAATDLAGNPMAANHVWSWTTAATDTTAPTVVLVNPAHLATGVATSSAVHATFSEAMDPLTITTTSFDVAGVTGVVSFNAVSKIATFTPNAALATSTTYTATVSTDVTDLAGNAMASPKVWQFTTAALPAVPPLIDLNTAAPFGTFGGTAGMTNTGTLTQVNGDIGTTATGTSMVTGFHDTAGDIYTETPANIGAVNGLIYTCTNSVTGPTSAGVNAAACVIATQARLDAQTAYQALVAMPAGANPGGNLANLTLAPGTYTAPAGSFMIQGGDLTLDGQGDANATWVFQMATTLTVGGPGAAFPQSIVLAGGAQAKNVYWQVGSFATVNAAGSGRMVGTIISQTGGSVSTAGNTNIVTLDGRILSLGASVTLVDTVINVPAP